MPAPALGQGQPARGAGTFPFTCQVWCLGSAAPVVLSGLHNSTLLTALLPHCCSVSLQPHLTCLQGRTYAAVLRASGEAKASRLCPRVSREGMEGTEGLGDGGAVSLAGAA